MAKPYTRQEMFVVTIARQIADGDNCLLGTGAPMIAGSIAKRLHAPAAKLMMESGIVDFVPHIPPIHIADSCCCEGYSHATSMFDMFTAITHCGHLDKAILGVGQIDRFGNLNSSYTQAPDGEWQRISGAGGAPEFFAYAKETILTLKGGEFVEKLPYFTSPGYFGGGNERYEKGRYPEGSGPSLLISPDAMYRFDPETREVYLAAVAPNVDVERIKARVPWALKIAGKLEPFPVPTDAELDFVRRFSPASCISSAAYKELVMKGAVDRAEKTRRFLEGVRQGKGRVG